MQLVDDVSAVSCQISDDSRDEDSDKEEQNIGTAPMQNLQTSDPSAILGKNGSIWTSSLITFSGKMQTGNVFTSTPGVAHSISSAISLPYCAWKHFLYQTILHSIVKFTNVEAKRWGDRDFCVSVDELQNAQGLYGKNHPEHFL